MVKVVNNMLICLMSVKMFQCAAVTLVSAQKLRVLVVNALSVVETCLNMASSGAIEGLRVTWLVCNEL